MCPRKDRKSVVEGKNLDPESSPIQKKKNATLLILLPHLLHGAHMRKGSFKLAAGHASDRGSRARHTAIS